MLKRLRRSRFVRDAAVLQVAAGVSSIGNLASTVAMAFLMGAHLQGTFMTAMSLYSLFYLLANVGLSTVTVSHMARAIGAGDRDGVVAWLGFLVKAGALLGVGMLLLALLVLRPISVQFYDDPRIVTWAIWLCCLPILELPRIVCAAAFQGTRRMVDLGQLENSVEIGRVFLIVSGLLITGEPEGALWGTLGAGFLGSVLAVISYRRVRLELMQAPNQKALLPGLKEMLGGMRMIPLRKGLPMGIQVGFMRNLDALVLDVAPMLIMSAVAGPAQAAYFRIAQRFLRMPLNFLQGISRTAIPAMAELAQIKDPARFRSTFYKASIGGGVIVSAGLLLALPLIPYVTRHLFQTPDYWEAVPHAAMILFAGFVITSFSGALESFYITANRVKPALRIGFGLGLPLIALMGVLGVLFGVDGVLVGCAISLSVGMVHHVYIWRCFASGTPILPAIIEPTPKA